MSGSDTRHRALIICPHRMSPALQPKCKADCLSLTGTYLYVPVWCCVNVVMLQVSIGRAVGSHVPGFSTAQPIRPLSRGHSPVVSDSSAAVSHCSLGGADGAVWGQHTALRKGKKPRGHIKCCTRTFSLLVGKQRLHSKHSVCELGACHMCVRLRRLRTCCCSCF